MANIVNAWWRVKRHLLIPSGRMSLRTVPGTAGFYAAGKSAGILIGLLTAIARIGVLGVCAATWWFGGVEPRIQFCLYAGLLSSLACWLAAIALQSLTLGIAAVPMPTVFAPVLAALLLGSCQVLPTLEPCCSPMPTTK